MNQDIVLDVGATISQKDIENISERIANAFDVGAANGLAKIKKRIDAEFSSLSPSQRVLVSQSTIQQTRLAKAAALAGSKTLAQKERINLEYANFEEMVRTAALNPSRIAVRSELGLSRITGAISALNQKDVRLADTLSKQLLALTSQRLAAGMPTDTLRSATDAMIAWNLKRARAYNIAANVPGITAQEREVLLRQASLRAKTAESLWGPVGLENPGTQKDLEIKRNTEALKRLTRVQAAWLTFAPTFAGKAIVGAAEYAGYALPSIWGEAVTRNVMASRHAQLERYEKRAGIIGNVLGFGVGGAAGGVALGALGAKIGAGVGATLGSLAPGIGNVIGATAGIAIGGTIGAGVGKLVGPLMAAWEKTELARKEATRDVALSARRDFFTYGGKTGHSFGKMLEQAKLASASSYNQMRWTGETLPGAMAFGMLGEQDMLMLSLMPEYYAALMNGLSGAELAAAYQSATSNLPSMLRPLVATSVPGGSREMYSAAMDPLFGRMYWNNRAGLTSTSDQALVGLSEAMQSATINVSARNIGQGMDLVRADAAKMVRTGDQDFYDTTLVTPTALQAYYGLHRFERENGSVLYDTDALRAYERIAKETQQEATTPGDWTRLNELLGHFSRWTDKTFNINVMLNGSRAAQSYLTIDDVMTESQTNIVGSLN